LLENFNAQGELIKKMMCSKSNLILDDNNEPSSVCNTIWTKEKGDIEPEKILTNE